MKLSKLDVKSKKVTFVGLEDGSKTIQFFDVTKHQIRVSRNFIFTEKELKKVEWVSSSKGCIEEQFKQQPSEIQSNKRKLRAYWERQAKNLEMRKCENSRSFQHLIKSCLNVQHEHHRT